MVLLGEIRQVCRTLLTFTRPYLGTASSMSKTLAVSTQSGGVEQHWWIDVAARLEVALQLCAAGANLVAHGCSASMRWTSDLFGSIAANESSMCVAGGIGGESIIPGATDQAQGANSLRPQPEVKFSDVDEPVKRPICGLFLGPQVTVILQCAVESAAH